MMTSYGFTQAGAPPSNSWGSKYSELCRLLDRYDAVDEHAGNYLAAELRELIAKIQTKITEFKNSAHAGTGSDAAKQAKKVKETAAVQLLEASMADDLRYIPISALIDSCANDRMPLLSNTGRGWQKLFKSNAMSIVFTTLGGINAQWGAETLMINAANFWKPGRFPASILVHEYHHVLTRRNPSLYHDEFVAHWKQYDVLYGINGYPQGNGRQGRVTFLNQWILDDPRGYKQRANLGRAAVLTGPEDTGVVWSGHLNNV